MAYEKYSTDAIICGSFDRHTSDKAYLLFTREAGMVRATATSVRTEKSKQRFSLQDFSLARVSLVSGKAGWKITGTEPIGNPFMNSKDRAVRTLVHAVVRALKRFVSGEEPQPELFADVWEVLSAVDSLPNQAAEQIGFLQLMTEVRMAHKLGYIAVTPALEAVLETASVMKAVEAADEAMTPQLRKMLDGAYQVSHL